MLNVVVAVVGQVVGRVQGVHIVDVVVEEQVAAEGEGEQVAVVYEHVEEQREPAVAGAPSMLVVAQM